jgi:hypothetical protein
VKKAGEDKEAGDDENAGDEQLPAPDWRQIRV